MDSIKKFNLPNVKKYIDVVRIKIITIFFIISTSFFLQAYSIHELETINLYPQSLPVDFSKIKFNRNLNEYFVLDTKLRKIFIFDSQLSLKKSFFYKPYLNKITALNNRDWSAILNSNLKLISSKINDFVHLFKTTSNNIFIGCKEQNNKFYIYIYAINGNFITVLKLNEDIIVDIEYLDEQNYSLLCYKKGFYYYKQYINNQLIIDFKIEENLEAFPEKLHSKNNNIFIGYTDKSLKKFDSSGMSKMIFFKSYKDFFAGEINADVSLFSSKYILLPNKINYYNNQIYLFDGFDNNWKIVENYSHDFYAQYLNNKKITSVYKNKFIYENQVYNTSNRDIFNLGQLLKNNSKQFIGFNKANQVYYFVNNDISGYFNQNVKFNTIEIYENGIPIKFLKNIFWNDNDRLKELIKIHITDNGSIIFMFNSFIEIYNNKANYIGVHYFENKVIDITSNNNLIYALISNNELVKIKITNDSNKLFLDNIKILSSLKGYAYNPFYANDNKSILYSGRFEDNDNDGKITYADKLSIYKLSLDLTSFQKIIDDYKWNVEPVPNNSNTTIAYVKLKFQKKKLAGTSLFIIDSSGLIHNMLYQTKGFMHSLNWVDNNSLIFIEDWKNLSTIKYLDITLGKEKTIASFDSLINRTAINNFKLCILLNNNSNTSKNKQTNLFENLDYENLKRPKNIKLLTTAEILNPDSKKIAADSLKQNFNLSYVKFYDIVIAPDSVYLSPVNNTLPALRIDSLKFLSDNEFIYLVQKENNISELHYYNILNNKNYLITAFPFNVNEFTISNDKSLITLSADLNKKIILLQFNLLNYVYNESQNYSAIKGTIKSDLFDNSNFKVFSTQSNQFSYTDYSGNFFLDNIKEGFDLLYVTKENFLTLKIPEIIVSPYLVKDIGNMLVQQVNYSLYNEMLKYYNNNEIDRLLNKMNIVETFIGDKKLISNIKNYKNNLIILNGNFDRIEFEQIKYLTYNLFNCLPKSIKVNYIKNINKFNYHYDYLNEEYAIANLITNFETLNTKETNERIKIFFKNKFFKKIYSQFIQNNLNFIVSNNKFNDYIKPFSSFEEIIYSIDYYDLNKISDFYISEEELNELKMQKQIR